MINLFKLILEKTVDAFSKYYLSCLEGCMQIVLIH